MAEPNIVLTLRRKRDELESLIISYEQTLAATRCDLTHVNATLAIFEASGEMHQAASMGIQRIFRYREITKLCMAALESAGAPLDTRELAIAVIRAKGLDERDALLRKAVASHVIHAVKGQEKRRRIAKAGKRNGVCVWRIL
ncbi:MAG: Uncharacterized protein FD139_597 [Methylocystaceae bacterium]|nr:MAG: Uncharacterized protein FD148_725 [Methylocystaceae bacterium]KAF0211727.1 MAG: hypothetical protein FD172_1644 [Methylocystaceae bacterium]TXT47094.1 MAG: Uncharacterized protein FD139_597 [Methylocystaceae bacterium]